MSTHDDDTGSFLCAHDPYFTLLPESEVENEIPTFTVTEFEEVLNDTIAENDGFVAPNYDYVTTIAPMSTVTDIDSDEDNFINARIRPFHDTDQVKTDVLSLYFDVDLKTNFSQCMKMTALVKITAINMAISETHLHKILSLTKTTFIKLNCL